MVNTGDSLSIDVQLTLMDRIQRHTKSANAALLLAFLFVCVVVVPTISLAQEQDELRATIRSAILSDPRTSGFSSEQIQAIVEIITAEAQKDALTPGDITWHPQDADTLAAQDSIQSGVVSIECERSDVPCLFNDAFGLIGSDTTIPFTLGASSMALIWIFAEMIHRRRMRV